MPNASPRAAGKRKTAVTSPGKGKKAKLALPELPPFRVKVTFELDTVKYDVHTGAKIKTPPILRGPLLYEAEYLTELNFNGLLNKAAIAFGWCVEDLRTKLGHNGTCNFETSEVSPKSRLRCQLDWTLKVLHLEPGPYRAIRIYTTMPKPSTASVLIRDAPPMPPAPGYGCRPTYTVEDNLLALRLAHPVNQCALHLHTRCLVLPAGHFDLEEGGRINTWAYDIWVGAKGVDILNPTYPPTPAATPQATLPQPQARIYANTALPVQPLTEPSSRTTLPELENAETRSDKQHSKTPEVSSNHVDRHSTSLSYPTQDPSILEDLSVEDLATRYPKLIDAPMRKALEESGWLPCVPLNVLTPASWGYYKSNPLHIASRDHRRGSISV